MAFYADGLYPSDINLGDPTPPDTTGAVTATTTAAASVTASVPGAVSHATTAGATVSAGTGAVVSHATTAAATVDADLDPFAANLTHTTTAGASAAGNVASPATVSASTSATVIATASTASVTTGYRTVIRPVDYTAEGTADTVQFEAVDVFNGNRFPNRGSAVVRLRNTSGVDATARFLFAGEAPAGSGRDIQLPAGADVTTATWPHGWYTQPDGSVWVDFTSGSGVEMAVIDHYPAW